METARNETQPHDASTRANLEDKLVTAEGMVMRGGQPVCAARRFLLADAEMGGMVAFRSDEQGGPTTVVRQPFKDMIYLQLMAMPTGRNPTKRAAGCTKPAFETPLQLTVALAESSKASAANGTEAGLGIRDRPQVAHSTLYKWRLHPPRVAPNGLGLKELPEQREQLLLARHASVASAGQQRALGVLRRAQQPHYAAKDECILVRGARLAEHAPEDASQQRATPPGRRAPRVAEADRCKTSP